MVLLSLSGFLKLRSPLGLAFKVSARDDLDSGSKSSARL